ncbi:hypothetical protein ADIS_0918 [Lunatimonas lonarensis]|uniref:Uncharacterized protein n=1 Tax=Lunatimonas lonarensis TaxID=1232681 RepID=R7ZX31_9BACT|nr:hypothetical protein ADIS_0918 [Lunatimonas lonarensis]
MNWTDVFDNSWIAVLGYSEKDKMPSRNNLFWFKFGDK